MVDVSMAIISIVIPRLAFRCRVTTEGLLKDKVLTLGMPFIHAIHAAKFPIQSKGIHDDV